jgi:hypothetical protein
MSSLQERLIESMVKDFEDIKEFEEGKGLRKESALLLKRIISAKELLSGNKDLLTILEDLEAKTKIL